jgi:hypothetical protein
MWWSRSSRRQSDVVRPPVPGHRDIASVEDAAPALVNKGRAYVAVIGINAYCEWPPLRNAVRDAERAMEAFAALGFEPFGEPLVDGAATRDTLNHLVTDELRRLDGSDSLVLFFAGHGHTAAAWNDAMHAPNIEIPDEDEEILAVRSPSICLRPRLRASRLAPLQAP